MILPFMSLYCVHNWGGDHGHNWFCFSCRCSMITRGDGHLVGSVFSMLPFTSPCYVDSWHSDHDQCWFYFLHLFLPLPWALRQWLVGCFDFFVSFYLFYFVYFIAFLLLPSQLKQWSIGYVDDWGGDCDQCWFYFPVSKYLLNDNRGDGQLWPIMLILFFAPVSASSMTTEAMVSW